MACEDPRPGQSHNPGLGLGLEEQTIVFTLTCSLVNKLKVTYAHPSFDDASDGLPPSLSTRRVSHPSSASPEFSTSSPSSGFSLELHAVKLLGHRNHQCTIDVMELQLLPHVQEGWLSALTSVEDGLSLPCGEKPVLIDCTTCHCCVTV